MEERVDGKRCADGAAAASPCGLLKQRSVCPSLLLILLSMDACGCRLMGGAIARDGLAIRGSWSCVAAGGHIGRWRTRRAS